MVILFLILPVLGRAAREYRPAAINAHPWVARESSLKGSARHCFHKLCFDDNSCTQNGVPFGTPPDLTQNRRPD
jgi:hypothetical protein